MARAFGKLLRQFPFSKLTRTASTLRIKAVSEQEPDLFEESFPHPVDVDSALAFISQSADSDCSVILETQWDLWQHEKEWKLMPSRVSLVCFGPDFESDREDDLRIEFGIDTHFLPQTDLPNYLFMAQSNVRSLLHLVNELDEQFSVESRRLWTDSGENFAEKFQSQEKEQYLN